MASDESAVNGLEPAELDAIRGLGEAAGRALCTAIDYFDRNSVTNWQAVEKSFGDLAVELAQTQGILE